MAAESNETRFHKLADRGLGSIPAGRARTAEDIGQTPRIADSGDIYDIKQRLNQLLDTSGGNVILAAIANAAGKTVQDITNNNQAAEDVTRQFLADRIKEGTNPTEVADGVLAALGKDLARVVANDIINRLKD